VPDLLQATLKKHFQHSEFRPRQREIITSLLEGNNTLAILPTGGGKSLTFQLPALLFQGSTLVISPLLSLIRDQTQELIRKEIPVARIDSTLTSEERASELLKIKHNEVKLIYTSPETLANPEILILLKLQKISLVAIDEAHCITEWGHTFRPSYLYLPKLIRALKPQATLALTATATRKTASAIRKLFRIKTAHHFASSNLRSNLKYKITPTLPQQKDKHLLETLNSSENLPAVIYVMRQEQCEQVAHTLNQNGINTRSYHAGLSNKSRALIQDNFLTDKIQAVVATIAFGMGVNKPNIRSVIHYHLPKSPEGWMQESGRAGRDGNPSTCQLLACGDDIIPLNNFIHAKKITQNSLTTLISHLYSQGKTAQISPYHTRLTHDLHTSTLDIILARLEVSGHITFTHSSWRYIKIYQNFGHNHSLTDYSKKIRNALQHIIELDDRYDTHNAPEDFGITPINLWKNLNHLQHSGDFRLKPSGWLWNYKIKNPQADTQTISQNIYQDLTNQADLDNQKLLQVTKICSSRSCIPNQLAKFFGEKPSITCGQCSSCLAEKRPTKLPKTKTPPLTEEDLTIFHKLKNHPKKRFKTNQQLTRFLCGIPSPYLRHYWLDRHKHYAKFINYPYNEIHPYTQATLNAGD